jgi:hypothetical protein
MTTDPEHGRIESKLTRLGSRCRQRDIERPLLPAHLLLCGSQPSLAPALLIELHSNLATHRA